MYSYVIMYSTNYIFFFSSIRLHTRYWRDWSSDVCSSDLLRHPSERREPDREGSPEPEILPDQVRAVRSDAVIATGRSDFAKNGRATCSESIVIMVVYLSFQI